MKASEIVLRFTCGAVFGVAPMLLHLIRDVTPNMWLLTLGPAALGAASGLLAVHYGDRFWEALSNLLRLFRGPWR